MFGNFSFMTLFLGQFSIPNSFVSLFIFFILSYLLLKTMGCLFGCLMSSASIQKLFCGICSAFKCSFDEFVGEKMVSPSYSSAIFYELFYMLQFYFIYVGIEYYQPQRIIRRNKCVKTCKLLEQCLISDKCHACVCVFLNYFFHLETL